MLTTLLARVRETRDERRWRRAYRLELSEAITNRLWADGYRHGWRVTHGRALGRTLSGEHVELPFEEFLKKYLMDYLPPPSERSEEGRPGTAGTLGKIERIAACPDAVPPAHGESNVLGYGLSRSACSRTQRASSAAHSWLPWATQVRWGSTPASASDSSIAIVASIRVAMASATSKDGRPP